jgi:hypothetical protein
MFNEGGLFMERTTVQFSALLTGPMTNIIVDKAVILQEADITAHTATEQLDEEYGRKYWPETVTTVPV